jgi:hypothetical protein
MQGWARTYRIYLVDMARHRSLVVKGRCGGSGDYDSIYILSHKYKGNLPCIPSFHLKCKAVVSPVMVERTNLAAEATAAASCSCFRVLFSFCATASAADASWAADSAAVVASSAAARAFSAFAWASSRQAVHLRDKKFFSGW